METKLGSENNGGYYEESIRFQNAYTTGNNGNYQNRQNVALPDVPRPTANKLEAVQARKSTRKWKRLAVAFAVVSLILFGVLILLELVVIPKETAEMPSSSGNLVENNVSPGYQTSCLQLRENGVTESGYYNLQENEETGETYRTYCDMESAGGGWTLVATINDNNVQQKNSLNDQWFSNEEISVHNPYITRLWENKNPVGRLDEATSSDYKNPGYYTLQASNVLVQHIPNNRHILEDRRDVFLSYHSTDDFLKRHGGNLYSVYRNHYSLSPTNGESVPSLHNNLLEALANNANDIISGIPNFYRYDYGSDSNEIRTGGSNMFTSGNYGMQLYFLMPSCSYSLYYGSTYTCTAGQSIVSSRKTYPFFAVMSAGNYDHSRSSIYVRVRSYRSSTDAVRTYSGRLLNGNYEMQYSAYCRYGGSIPSLCDVSYVVNNTKDWKSSTEFTVNPSQTPYSTYYYSYFYANNYPTNVVMGYTMLSRTNGQLVTQNQTESALNKMLAAHTTFSNLFSTTCQNADDNLVIPVNYTVGADTVSNHIPPALSNVVTPGFMQFRAKSASGISYAFCPAVKVNTCLSRYLCVGGVRHNPGSSYTDCSDFLDWNAGQSLSNLYNNQGKDRAHSIQDIHSTVMIFYR